MISKGLFGKIIYSLRADEIQNARVELDRLQSDIMRDARACGADIDQVKELFMLQWEDFAKQGIYSDE